MTKNKLTNGKEKWIYISAEFTDELVEEWEDAGFSYEECTDWMKVFNINWVSTFILQMDFFKWLRDEKKIDAEWLATYGNLEELLKEYEEYALNSSSSGFFTKIAKKKVEELLVINPDTLMPVDWQKPKAKTLAEWKDEKIIENDEETELKDSGLIREDAKYTLEQLKQITKQIKRIKQGKSFINYNYFITPINYYNRHGTNFPLIKSAEEEPLGNSTYAIYNK